MSNVDRLLEVLDGGLQRSPEASYGQDHDQSLCARCRRYPHVVDGDLCALCRVFLLGDSDDDPTKPHPKLTVDEDVVGVVFFPPPPSDANLDVSIYAQARARINAEVRGALVEAFHQFARRG